MWKCEKTSKVLIFDEIHIIPRDGDKLQLRQFQRVSAIFKKKNFA